MPNQKEDEGNFRRRDRSGTPRDQTTIWELRTEATTTRRRPNAVVARHPPTPRIACSPALTISPSSKLTPPKIYFQPPKLNASELASIYWFSEVGKPLAFLRNCARLVQNQPIFSHLRSRFLHQRTCHILTPFPFLASSSSAEQPECYCAFVCGNLYQMTQ